MIRVEDLLALEFECEIAGTSHAIGRSLETLKCIEEAAGMSAAAFADRIDRRAATIAELTRVYAAVLRRVPKAPTNRQIEEWLYATGTHHVRFAIWVCSLTIGSDVLDQVLNARRTGAPPPQEGGRRPFDPMDGSTGTSSWDWASALAGLRPSSGPPPTST